ncbi:MAG: RNA polymerase sigma factor [Actinomycetota bacterium]
MPKRTIAARPVHELSFAEDLRAARGGDGVAFERLITPVLSQLRGYVRAQAGREQADDLVADVLLRVFGAVGRFEGSEAQFRSWVFTIAHHRVIDARRRFRRHEPLAEDCACEIAGGDSEADAMARLGELEITRVLRLLSPMQRHVLMLRVVADLSVEETARILGKQPNAVRAIQHRALTTIRKKIRGKA